MDSYLISSQRSDRLLPHQLPGEGWTPTSELVRGVMDSYHTSNKWSDELLCTLPAARGMIDSYLTGTEGSYGLQPRQCQGIDELLHHSSQGSDGLLPRQNTGKFWTTTLPAARGVMDSYLTSSQGRDSYLARQ